MSNSQIISFCNIASDKKKEACAIFKRQVAWFGGDQSSWVDLLAISVVRIIFFPYSAAKKNHLLVFFLQEIVSLNWSGFGLCDFSCSCVKGLLVCCRCFPPRSFHSSNDQCKRLGPINISLPFMTADSAGIQFIRDNRSARALSRFDYMWVFD